MLEEEGAPEDGETENGPKQQCRPQTSVE